MDSEFVYPRKPCQDCESGNWLLNGNGICSECGGRGTVAMVENRETKQVCCPRCDGTKKCPTCGGAGTLPL